MRRSLIVAFALILLLAPAAMPQEQENAVPKDTGPPAPVIIAPQSSRAGRAFFDQKRYAEAKPLLEKACNIGNADSCGLLGDLYYYGYGGAAQDYEQTRLLDKQACDGGSIESCGNLGLLWEKGLGGAKNYTEARSLQESL